MPYVRKYRDGYRCEVCVNGNRGSMAGFRTKGDAYDWGREQEKVLEVETAPPKTFGEVAEEWLELRIPEMKHPSHQRAVEYTVRQFMLPALKDRPIKDIKRTELVAVVQAVAKRGTVETSHRTAQRLNKIFKHAMSSGYIDSHPAQELVEVLPVRQDPDPMPCVEVHEAGQLMADIANWRDPVTRLGLQLLAHTFVRTIELRGARWSEFDFEEKVWTIPGERMKGKKSKRRPPHYVPLSRQALLILTELKAINGSQPFVLSSPLNPLCPISENTMLFALYDMDYQGRMTGHGFRALASTILNKETKWREDAIERQLSHGPKDKVRAAYLRDKYIEERIPMMQWYSEYLTRVEREARKSQLKAVA